MFDCTWKEAQGTVRHSTGKQEGIIDAILFFIEVYEKFPLFWGRIYEDEVTPNIIGRKVKCYIVYLFISFLINSNLFSNSSFILLFI